MKIIVQAGNNQGNNFWVWLNWSLNVQQAQAMFYRNWNITIKHVLRIETDFSLQYFACAVLIKLPITLLDKLKCE